MKTVYFKILFLLGLIPFISCSEEKVEPFSDKTGINFSTYPSVSTDINFYQLYVENGMDIMEKNVRLYVQLEGRLSDKPTNIRLKTMEVEEFEMADIVLPADSAIAPGEYQRGITVTCMKPSVYDKEFRTYVTFDYANSDVVPGSMEFNKKRFTVKDQTMWSDMYVDNEEKWNEKYESTLGKYGPVKVRFIMAALGAMDLDYNRIKSLYSYTVSYPNYGFKNYISSLNSALEEYNNTHDEPLREPDGTLVSFN